MDKENNSSLETSLNTLAQKIDDLLGEKKLLETQIPYLRLSKFCGPTKPTGYIHETSLCMIAQGAKSVRFKSTTYNYNRNSYLITPLDLPVEACVTDGSKEKPYLGLLLRIDHKIISQLVLESNYTLKKTSSDELGIATGNVSYDLVDSMIRLLGLLKRPEDIPVMLPLIYKEILYRILNGTNGSLLFQLGIVGSRSNQISRAIEWLKQNFTSPLRIEDLAEKSGMSNSTFHHHFKDLTDMSPLQYQKWLRLSEARRLMMTEMLDASSASFRVGYESPSQFSREYSRLFGLPPSKDIKNALKAS